MKIESLQYQVCLAITEAIKGTAHNKMYEELGLESIKSRKRIQRLYVI